VHILRILFIGSYIRTREWWTQNSNDINFFSEIGSLSLEEMHFALNQGQIDLVKANSLRSQRDLSKTQALLPLLAADSFEVTRVSIRWAICRGMRQNGADFTPYLPPILYGTSSETCSSGPKFIPVDSCLKSPMISSFFANRITQSREILRFVFASENQSQNNVVRVSPDGYDRMASNLYQWIVVSGLQWFQVFSQIGLLSPEKIHFAWNQGFFAVHFLQRDQLMKCRWCNDDGCARVGWFEGVGGGYSRMMESDGLCDRKWESNVANCRQNEEITITSMWLRGAGLCESCTCGKGDDFSSAYR
jgi:hypothetical protein